MKVLPFKIPKPKNEALVYQIDNEWVFYDQLHQHAEIQISFIERGTGTLLVGDTINEYLNNDIVVIGGFLPHVFRSDSDSPEISTMHTLFFDYNSFGEIFFKLPDMTETKDFFKKSMYGMKIISNKERIIDNFKKLSNQNNVEQIGTLLYIINEITKAKTIPLSSFIYAKTYSDPEGKRMNDVVNFAMEKFRDPIKLEEISDLANMSKNAFCRYFKKRTNKTFFQFLIEIRIENACKLIVNKPELSISLISDQCGFSNIANFNRKFKELKGCTPSQYRIKF